METLHGNRIQEESGISRFSVDEDFDNSYPLTDGNDFHVEFAYEDYKKMTGKSYRDYLRFHDDMI